MSETLSKIPTAVELEIPRKRQEWLEKAMTLIVESADQAEHDLCGEQREWHLPRLQQAYLILLLLFPEEGLRAGEKARTPYDA